MDETEQEKEETCLYDASHIGPFHRYMWNNRVSKNRRYAAYGALCEKCAKSVGAWQLPDKVKK